MADANQTGRKDVPRETADKLESAQGQRLNFGAVPVIAVSERRSCGGLPASSKTVLFFWLQKPGAPLELECGWASVKYSG